MINQYINVRTGYVERMIFSLLLSFAIIFALVFCLGRANIVNFSLPWNLGVYLKPAIDKTAREGVLADEVTRGFDINEIAIANGISFSMAGVLYRQADGSVKIFLTNPSGAKVNLLCEIKDANSERTLFKSGLINAGHYVERLTPRARWENAETPIKIYVYAIDAETNMSRGTIELETALQPW